MNPVQFIWPADNMISLGLIYCLALLFITWLGCLGYSLVGIKKACKAIKACNDVRPLTGDTLISSQAVAPGAAENAAVKEESLAGQGDEIEIELYEGGLGDEEKWERYCSWRGIDRSGAVARHIERIYLAGRKQLRLEVSELLSLTTERLFSFNNFLKGLMSIFIIVGLLGTLAGLASSLAQLAPALSGINNAQQSHLIAVSLNSLMLYLRSAFAPSIWGVALTILSVLIYLVYLRGYCLPTKQLLDQYTIENWVPELYPTAPQRLYELMVKSEEQLSKDFETAKKVSDFAIAIEKDAISFKKNIREANSGLETLAKAGEVFSDFASSFTAVVDQLASIKDNISGHYAEIDTLYRQMTGALTLFQQRVEAVLGNIDYCNRQLTEKLELQGNQLGEAIKTLKLYEDNYVDRMKLIESNNHDLLVSAQGVYDDIGRRNRELVEAFGRPLNDLLVEKLNGIMRTLTEQLKLIQERFNSFDTPLREAASHFSGSLEAMVKRTESMNKELHHNLEERFAGSDQQIIKTNEQIIELLGQLISDNKTNVVTMRDLNNAIATLCEHIPAMNRDTGRMGMPVGTGSKKSPGKLPLWQKIGGWFKRSGH